jgi:hypothetical protein
MSGKSAEFKTTVFPSTGQTPGEMVSVMVRDSTGHTLIGDAVALSAPELRASA